MSNIIAIKKCAVCESPFTRKKRQRYSAFKQQKSCSLKCRQKYIAQVLRARWKARMCRICGKEIAARESRRLYCSIACLGKSNQGAGNPMWKGGKKKHGKYTMLLIKNHPFTDANGYMFEHRFVVEEHLKETDPSSKYLVEIGGEKYLSPDVIVHHKNNVKGDNRIENLQPVSSQSEHFAYHFCPHCSHCKKIG